VKIAEVFAHLVICLLAHGVEAEGRWWSKLDKEHRMLVELHGECCNHVGCVTEARGVVKLIGDFERAVAAKEVEQQ